MRLTTTVALLVCWQNGAESFQVGRSRLFSSTDSSSSSALSMVLEKPVTKKLAKIEQLKVDSDHLIHPLREVRLETLCVDCNSFVSLVLFIFLTAVLQ